MSLLSEKADCAHTIIKNISLKNLSLHCFPNDLSVPIDRVTPVCEFVQPTLLSKSTNSFWKWIPEHVHTYLRLPQYHLHLSPIACVGAKMERDIRVGSTTVKFHNIKVLIVIALAKFDKENKMVKMWGECIKAGGCILENW